MRPTALLAIIIFLCLVSAAAAAPLLPSEFYGDITINGAPAPAGTVINATINGETVGTFVTLSPGIYGGPGTFDERLSVIGTEDGQSVAFFINGEIANETSIYHPGTTQRLDLSIVIVETTPGTNGTTTFSAASSANATQPTGQPTQAVTISSTSVQTAPIQEITIYATSVPTQPTEVTTPVETSTPVSMVSPAPSISVPETQMQVTVPESGQPTAVPSPARTDETLSVTPTQPPGFTLQTCGIAGILLAGWYGLRHRRK